jgi:hypothetical protein
VFTFAEMRESGVRALLVYCADYRCSHSIAIAVMAGRMIFGYPMLSRVLSARRAASAAPTCGRISIHPQGSMLRYVDSHPESAWD